MQLQRALSRLATVAVAALIASGCTAGVIVDKDFNAFSVLNVGLLRFAAVDSDGTDTGTTFDYVLAGGVGYDNSKVSFDPYATDTMTVADKPINGVRNSGTFIPPGSYYIIYNSSIIDEPSLGAQQVHGSSKIFSHQYTESCTDYFNGGTDRCAQYYFQVLSDTPSCSGTRCFGPPLGTHSGIPVIPIYVTQNAGGILQP